MDWFAIAERINSPLGVTRAVSPVSGVFLNSADVGLDPCRLHGPGESLDMTGDGRGVRSGIELSIGDDNAEFGAETVCEFDPMLLARTCLMLGVLAMDMGFEGRRSSLVSDAAERAWLVATSICSRRPDALMGLEYEVDGSQYLCRVLSRGDGIVGALDRSHTAGGGEGAIVVDLKIGSAAAVCCSSTAALCLAF